MKYRSHTPPDNSEAGLQVLVCDYLRVKYPTALFRSDASGLRLRPTQAIMHKRLQSSRAWPDLIIYEPRRDHTGLAIELKREDIRTHRKDGSLSTDPHVVEQDAMLKRLRRRGYKAEFAHGWLEARTLIDDYLAPSRVDRTPEPF